MGRGGVLLVEGRAAPDARVRATTFEGEAYGATAGRDGGFRLELPARPGPRLVALSLEIDGRPVEGDGWLFVPPDAPGRAVMLRPGAGAGAIGSGNRLELVAADYDTGGGAALSGRAAPGETVEISVDDQPAARAETDAAGLFAFRLDGRVPPGPRRILAVAPSGRVARTVVFAPPRAVAAVDAVREAGGWRVTWPTPGGGAQTTLVFTGDAGA